MNVKSVEKTENFTVDLIVEVGQEEFEAAVEKVYKKNRGSISIPGFRKGKAPRKVIEGMYGTGVFYEDAFEDLYPAACEAAVTSEDLDIVAAPKVEVMDLGKNGFTFRAICTVRPAVEMADYKGIEAEKVLAAVTEEEVEKDLQVYIERASHLEPVDRPAEMGDTATIDYEGFEDGVPFVGGKGENYELALGSKAFIPGFEEKVVGMSAGEERDIELTFPAEYHAPELAGKGVVFHVKCQEVKAKVAPAIDDEFAKDVSEFDTLEEFKQSIKEKIVERNMAQSDMKFKQNLLDKLIEKVTIELPAPMVETQIDRFMDDYRARLEQQGISLEMYYSYLKIDEEKMRAELRPGAERQIRTQLALDGIAAAENVQITDEEIDEQFKQIAESMKTTQEEVEKMLPRNSFRRDMARDRALNIVSDNAKVKMIEATKEENGEISIQEVKADDEEAETEDKPAKKPRAKKTAAKTADGEAEGEEAAKKSTRKKKTDAEANDETKAEG